PPSDVLRRTNRHLLPKLQQQRMMVTMLYGILDIREHTLTFSNAGQGYPLLCYNGESQYLENSGIPLGGFEQPMYDDCTIPIPPDATLVLYSDGFIEMVGANGELLGFDRFQQMVIQYAHLPVPQMVERLLDTAIRFGDKRFERDDLTLVIIKRTGGR
ncbi:MAG: serine/threonine-protein phosphatase, partial [Abditibacteriales bacterium]|nr:serine/threonine-protein phosphatase [Abditibacteriales bacterium]MDW8367896.1 PP2C family protein-serine/threonine phosphatase [Abditibacteriales bacterium]